MACPCGFEGNHPHQCEIESYDGKDHRGVRSLIAHIKRIAT